MTLFHPIVILNGGKNALWEKRKRNSGTEWRIYYTDDILPIFLTTGTDPSRSFRMTLNVSLIMTLFHPIVIQSFGKNALWEERETE